MGELPKEISSKPIRFQWLPLRFLFYIIEDMSYIIWLNINGWSKAVVR